MSRRPLVATARGASTRPLGEALGSSQPLANLLARVGESKALLAAVRPLLPPGLAGQVTAGPLDAEGWSLLCGNPAVAAKLRQLVPRLEQRLRADGRPVAAVRVKVQQPTTEGSTIGP